jgi:uncharacterized membrane protein YkoI
MKWLASFVVGVLAVGGVAYGAQASEDNVKPVPSVTPIKDEQPSVPAVKITPEEAKQIALQSVGNKGRVTEVSLEETKGQPIYEVEITNGQDDDDDIHVHAITKKIVPDDDDDSDDRYELDDDDDKDDCDDRDDDDDDHDD